MNLCEGSDVGGKNYFLIGIDIDMRMKNFHISINVIQNGADAKEMG